MNNIDKLVLFENEDLVAVNKPSGLLTIPDRFDNTLPSLSKTLQYKYENIFVIHRLDRETSGVLLFAKNSTAHECLSRQFEAREVEKFYLALVNGRPSEKKGRIEAAIGENPGRKGKMMLHKKGKNAVSDYEVLEEFALYSWLKVQIHTGRTHQIRVHLQSIGHPVVMDELYGTIQPVFLSALKRNYRLGKQQEEERPLLQRLALHAAALTFTLPDGESRTVEAPLSRDLNATLQQLRKHKERTSGGI